MIRQRTIRRAAVTGASGFIGSHLVERLAARGIEVVALAHANAGGQIGNLAHLPAAVRGRLTVRFIDVLDPNDVRAALDSADTVFHLAANISVPYSAAAPMLFIQTNTIGTLNVLKAAREAGAERVVVISSSEVYGSARIFPIREDHVLSARSPYAASKISAEKLAESFFHCFGLGVVVLRPFNTYGPRQSLRAVIPWIIQQGLDGGDLQLGNLKPVRDFVFVTDTADGMIAAGETAGVEGETFNLATGAGLSVEELVGKISAAIGRPLRIKNSPDQTRAASSEVWKLVGGADKAAEQLGWTPKVSIDDGLPRVVEFIRSSLKTRAGS